jgi:regulator of Ty1 transposition protein 103
VLAFSPIIAEATATAYKGAPPDVQNKLRRVVDVWRDRNLFEQPIQEAIEARLEGESMLSLWELRRHFADLDYRNRQDARTV